VRIHRIIDRHMIAKIFLAVALVVGAALLIQTVRDVRHEARTLKQETRKSAETVTRMIIGAVEHSMLSGEGIQVRALISELVERVPEAVIQVFDQRGIEVFAPKGPAPGSAEIPAPVRAALAEQIRQIAGDRIHRPIRSEERCQECHADDAALRGALAIELDRASCAAEREDSLTRLVASGFVHLMAAGRSKLVGAYFVELGEAVPSVRGVLAVSLAARADASCQAEELEGVIDTSLRYIMLSRLGRRIADFLDAAADTGPVRTLELYDREGRRYWTTNHPEPPELVAEVLASGAGQTRLLGDGASERSLVVEPLANRSECMRCHGSDSEVRGAVSVSLSTAAAARARAETVEARAFFSAGTLLGILVVLVGLLQYFVLRPVREIGDVADAVGGGDLSARVARARQEGDEVARLGYRINSMVSGLRAKAQLEKFVSRGAVNAAETADLAGVARSGERRAATVLFSDIRGFTTYSETVAPEAVVDMLNRVLDAQARVVHQHGGDIDKFVGDELMAVFQGERAEARAVRAAVEMVEAVHDARVAGENFAVGVGVATGEVVYGAMGSETRMDFTVIGDVVNTGARLCSAAEGDEVLVTSAVAEALGAAEDIQLSQHEPIQARGKREPVLVFAARRRRGDR
jgi:adenylate cyclase